jgi:predicted DNA-binding protein (MmcQ/YjbR family)
MDSAAMFERFKAICLAHPDTCLTMTWGSPHFRIGGEHGKIFAGCGDDANGQWSIGVRVEPDLQAALVASDNRFKVAAYVGKYGGVDFYPGASPNWGEIEALVATSYRIIKSGMTRGSGGKRKAPVMKPKPKPKPKAKVAKRTVAAKQKSKATRKGGKR